MNRARTANVLFTKGLSQKQKDIGAFVVHPGMVLETGIGGAVDEASWKQAWEMDKQMNIAPPTAKNGQEGCATGLVAALDPAVNGLLLKLPSEIAGANEYIGKSGAYLIDCNIMPAVEHATSPELAEKLWKLSEELLGEKFAI